MTFIVFSLPRSRSAWIAHFLSYGGKRCGHDLAVDCGSLDEFAGLLRGTYDGTAETGSVIGWRSLRRNLPDAKMAVVRRPVSEVMASLAQLGINFPGLESEMVKRDAMLDELSHVPGVKSFAFSDLTSPSVCAALFEHCLDETFDWEWWEGLAHIDVQIDVADELRRVAENRSGIEAMKREAAAETPEIAIAQEPWGSVWPAIDTLFAEHFGEVEGDLAEQRPYSLDEPAMRALCAAGVMQIWTARVDGILAGYCMWQVDRDVESAGRLIAQHGPWYVRDEYARLKLGPKLFDTSISGLRQMGVTHAYPHHRMIGRGAKLGTFYRRRGAVEMQRTFSMCLQHA